MAPRYKEWSRSASGIQPVRQVAVRAIRRYAKRHFVDRYFADRYFAEPGAPMTSFLLPPPRLRCGSASHRTHRSALKLPFHSKPGRQKRLVVRNLLILASQER